MLCLDVPTITAYAQMPHRGSLLLLPVEDIDASHFVGVIAPNAGKAGVYCVFVLQGQRALNEA